MEGTFEPVPNFEEDVDLDLEELEIPEQEAEEDTFPEEMSQDFFGLAMIGYLEEEFILYHHKISIKTLKTEEELAATLLIRDYEGTIGQGKAGATAFVAACLISIDNQALPRALSNNAVESLRERYNYIITNYDYDTVILPIYAQYRNLVDRKIEIAEALQLKSIASRNTL